MVSLFAVIVYRGIVNSFVCPREWHSVGSCAAWALFHKTLKTSLRRLAGLCKDVFFMFYETEPWNCVEQNVQL